MKNVMKHLALVAFCATAAVSCQKSEVVGSGNESDIFFTLNTGDTRTYMVAEGNNYQPMWAKGDEIGVLFQGFAKDKSSPQGKLTNVNENGKTASFEGTISAENAGTLYAFYPSKIAKTYDNETVGFDIPANQKPTATSFDPAADLLVSKPLSYNADGGVVSIDDVFFARALSILKIKVYSTDFEAIKGQYLGKLTVTASDTLLSGRPVFDLTKGDAKVVKYNTQNKSVGALYDEDIVSVGTSKTATGCSVFLMVAPVTHKSGATLKFEGETSGYKFSKEVTLPSDIILSPGKFTEINLSLAETNCEVKVAETRIWVDNFEKCTENKTKYEVSQTGAKGTGLNDNTSYDYGTGDIRINNNGHSSSDPYLYVPGGNTFTVKNLSVSEETALILSAQTKNAGNVTLKYKESAAETWTEIGSWTSTSSFSEQKTIFTIAGTATSIDLSFTASASIIIDDIVLEKFVDQRTQLNVPSNVKAEKDAATSNKVNVSWGTVENAGSYEITLSTEGEEDVVEDAETNSISFTGLKYSTQYSVKVKAISSDVSLYKDSEYSSPVNVTTGEQPAVMIYFEKITSIDQIVDNEEYLIVHSTDAIFDGSRDASTIDGSNNYIEITSSDVTASGISYDTYKNYCVYIASMEGGYSFKTKGGVYFGRTTDSNGFNTSTTSAYANTLTFGENGTVVIKGTARAFGYLNNKFRFYAASNAKDIYLYKKADPRTALATPEITVTPDNTNKKITVSWTVVANAANYTVTCGQAEKTETGTSCEFTGLAYGDYTVTVQANPTSGSTTYRASEKASKDVSLVDTTPTINAENPTAVESTATSVEVEYSVSNKTDGVNLTAAVTSGDWISNPQVAADKVTFTLTANTTSVQRTGTVTLSYPGAESKVVTITQKGVGQNVYASLEDLVAAGAPTGANVTVTFSNKEIIDFYKSGQYTNGIWLSVAGAPNNKIEIYCRNVPAEWEVGGLVSGTLTNCEWKKYNDIWELCPSNWDDITYTAPLPKCETPVITLDGAKASITCATSGATILYEISATEPASFTKTYSSPVTLTDGQTIWAKAIKNEYRPSNIVSRKYTAGGSAEPVELTFDLSKNPGNWPTTNSTEFTDYTYTLDGTDYTFGLKSVKCNSGYLMLTQTAVLGLPAIDGKKLTKIVAKNSSGCSTSTKVGVSSSSDSASYISGGEIQTWSTQSSTYTYTLTGTADNKVYFLYVTNKNAQITELTLIYE